MEIVSRQDARAGEAGEGRMVLMLALIECFLSGGAACAALQLLAGSQAGGAALLGGTIERAAAISLSCAAAFYYGDLYDLHAVRSFRDFLSRLPRSAALALALTLLAWWAVSAPGFPGLLPLAIVPITLAILLPLRGLVYAIASHPPFVQRTLVLGTGHLARRVAREINARPEALHTVIGFVGEVPGDPSELLGAPIVGTLDDLGPVLAQTTPRRIVVALRDRRERLPVQLLLEARVRGIAVEDAVDLLERLTGKIAIESVSPGALAFSSGFSCTRVHELVARATSFVAALAGLILLAPLMVIIALLIKIGSRGPVLFVQDRAGLGGARFELLKFRTMVPADRRTSEWAGDNDDRITRVGRWLRKFRLDELPQFVNVLRGEINLVGPRPHPASNFDLFNRSVPYYRLRAMVRPGITGWAQVRYGYANNLEEETEKMRYDLYYIKHRSFVMDAVILLDTIKVVLLGRGADARDAAPVGALARGPSVSFLPEMPWRHHRTRALAGRSGRSLFISTLGPGDRPGRRAHRGDAEEAFHGRGIP